MKVILGLCVRVMFVDDVYSFIPTMCDMHDIVSVAPPPPPAPRAPPFSPSPSLQKVADFIVTDCVRRYPKEECPLCNERALPMDPSVCNYVDLKVSAVVVCGRVCCIRDESSC